MLVRAEHGRQQSQKPSHYKYRPLQTSGSIRLLQLKPGKDDEPIRCWLFEVRLDDWPLYQALSYTWGSPTDKSTIVCNESTVSIPRNLAEGLRVLRHPDRLKILWQDAVCINQKDPEERGSQVQLMSRIFSEASRVLVWLGHGQPSMVHTAFQYICGVLKYGEKDALANYKWKGIEVNVCDREFDIRNVPPIEPPVLPLNIFSSVRTSDEVGSYKRLCSPKPQRSSGVKPASTTSGCNQSPEISIIITETDSRSLLRKVCGPWTGSDNFEGYFTTRTSNSRSPRSYTVQRFKRSVTPGTTSMGSRLAEDMS